MHDQGALPPTRPSLLRRLADRSDHEAWTTFVDVYGKFILEQCRKRWHLQDADADDARQEILKQAFLSIHHGVYRPERGRFRSFLFTMAQNIVRRLRRRQHGQVQGRGCGETDNLLDNLATPEQENDWGEDYKRHLVRVALQRIEPHFDALTWKAFVGVWLEERSPDEVARELGKTRNWVYVAKCRVRKRLEEEVKQLDEDGLL